MGGNAAVARVLVEHGADVNRRDSEGKTVTMVRVVSVRGVIDTSCIEKPCFFRLKCTYH